MTCAFVALPQRARRCDGPDFINAVVELETALEPHALLAELQRSKPAPAASAPTAMRRARSISTCCATATPCIDTATLTLPHPRMTERAFVLLPLAEIAPDQVTSDADRTRSAGPADRAALTADVRARPLHLRGFSRRRHTVCAVTAANPGERHVRQAAAARGQFFRDVQPARRPHRRRRARLHAADRATTTTCTCARSTTATSTTPSARPTASRTRSTGCCTRPSSRRSTASRSTG